MPRVTKAVFALLAFAALSLGSASAARADALTLQGVTQLGLTNGTVPINSLFTLSAVLGNPGSRTIFLTDREVFENGVFLFTRPYPSDTLLDPGASGRFLLAGNARFLPGTPLGPTLLTFVIRGGTVPGATDVLTTVRVSVVVTPEAVPEPATLVLLGTGLAGVVGAARKRRKAPPAV